MSKFIIVRKWRVAFVLLFAFVFGGRCELDSSEAVQVSFPANVSGTFKGNWISLTPNLTRSDWSNATINVTDQSKSSPSSISGSNVGAGVGGLHNKLPPKVRSLHKEQGVIIYQLVTTPTQHPDVHYVQGEMVIREGMYVTENDVHMQLEGVYLKPTGTLRLYMNSDIVEELTQEEYGDQSEEYRAALRKVAYEAVFRGRLPESSRALVPMIEGVDPSDQPLGALNLTLQKRCKFKMTGTLREGGLATWDGQRRAPAGDSKGSKKGAAETVEIFGTTLFDPEQHDKIGSSSLLALEFDGVLSSPNCGLALSVNTTSIQLQAYYNKAINYTLLVTVVAFLQVALMVLQMEYSNTQAAAAKVSLLVVGQQAIMDAYLCLLHLTVGIVMDQLFNAFATAAFFQFIVFSMFEMRYMLTIWKARQAPQLDTWNALRQELSLLYSRFYGLMLLGILLIYQMQGLVRYVVLFFHSFWWPQIVRNVVHDVKRPLHIYYILGTTATRLLVPLYIYGCPHNFMRQAPDYNFCGYLISYMGIQVSILLLQHFAGPRCFVPARFLPTKYNYHRKVDSQALLEMDIEMGETHETDCVICMSTIQTSNTSRRMVTPCDHFFHIQCLQRWMEVKMECPTCRRPLPPL